MQNVALVDLKGAGRVLDLGLHGAVRDRLALGQGRGQDRGRDLVGGQGRGVDLGVAGVDELVGGRDRGDLRGDLHAVLLPAIRHARAQVGAGEGEGEQAGAGVVGELAGRRGLAVGRGQAHIGLAVELGGLVGKARRQGVGHGHGGVAHEGVHAELVDLLGDAVHKLVAHAGLGVGHADKVGRAQVERLAVVLGRRVNRRHGQGIGHHDGRRIGRLGCERGRVVLLCRHGVVGERQGGQHVRCRDDAHGAVAHREDGEALVRCARLAPDLGAVPVHIEGQVAVEGADDLPGAVVALGQLELLAVVGRVLGDQSHLVAVAGALDHGQSHGLVGGEDVEGAVVGLVGIRGRGRQCRAGHYGHGQNRGRQCAEQAAGRLASGSHGGPPPRASCCLSLPSALSSCLRYGERAQKAPTPSYIYIPFPF